MLNTQSMSDPIYLYQAVPLSPPSQSVPLSSRPLHLCTTIPQHVVISLIHCIGYASPFTVTADDMHCHDVMIHIDCILNLCFLVYELTRTHKDSQFSPQVVLAVLKI
jgi:hypothetical protein